MRSVKVPKPVWEGEVVGKTSHGSRFQAESPRMSEVRLGEERGGAAEERVSLQRAQHVQRPSCSGNRGGNQPLGAGVGADWGWPGACSPARGVRCLPALSDPPPPPRPRGRLGGASSPPPPRPRGGRTAGRGRLMGCAARVPGSGPRPR